METKQRRCPVSSVCGGCSFAEVDYEQQIKDKQAFVEGLFGGKIVLPIIGMDDFVGYRNKVISPFAPEKTKSKASKKILTGMYGKGTHRLVNTDGCLLENKAANDVVVAIRDIMKKYRMEPYDEDTGEGFMRHVVVRVGHNSHEMLVTIVTAEEGFVGAKNFCKELIKRCPGVTSVIQNINTRKTNVILGDKEKVLYGPGFILDKLCGLSFRISSRSFYQVNATQTEVLYKTAVNAAKLTGQETLIDAYCGTGTIGLVAAAGIDNSKGAKRVIGVDSVASAIDDARLNAKHNGIANAEFVVGDATEFMKRLASDVVSGTFDNKNAVLMMDPPRSGSTEEFLGAVVSAGISRIVYISCNPQTQLRDITYLQGHGYALESVQPVDMFPCTEHVETVALLEAL
ncbi:MAG: 23S rRNA (uracil(1939)-C(5))-methyltransferase RlmD [Eggerthellaceae bacterium]|nr:23S rRNA (uracil(1939)-C(5))-methyltransferase RlmD [Eggerthellaceae bacterium]